MILMRACVRIQYDIYTILLTNVKHMSALSESEIYIRAILS